MKNLRFIRFVAILVMATHSAQAAKDTLSYKYDTAYIQTYKDKLQLTFLGSVKNSTLTLLNKVATDSSISYRTNNRYSWGVGIDYKWFSLELSTKLPVQTRENKPKGESDVSSLKIGLTGRKLWLSAGAQVYKGMYVNSPWLADTTRVDNPLLKKYIVRSDLEVTNVQVSANYCFKGKKYSPRAALYQLERQKKNAGSFVAGATALVNAFAADSSILIPMPYAYYQPLANVKNALNTYLGLNFGYAHTWVLWKYYYINFSFIPGINRQTGQYTLSDETTYNYRKLVAAHLESRFGLGYNNDKFFCGFWAWSTNFTDNQQKGGPLQYKYNQFRLFVGYRFALKRNVPIIDRIKL
jgi:hypothetical protein